MTSTPRTTSSTKRRCSFSAHGLANVSALLSLLLTIIAALTTWSTSSAVLKDGVRQFIAGYTEVNGTC